MIFSELCIICLTVDGSVFIRDAISKLEVKAFGNDFKKECTKNEVK